jgi:uncharacterized membrane protein
MTKSRLEAFSDGVLAVAITLLALDLHVDAGDGAGLARQLAREWPSFAAFAVSFFVIGVIWVNHHALFALAGEVDRTLMFYNMMLLMWVTTIPFTTSTLAAYLRGGGADGRLAVLLYGASWEGMAVSFTLIFRHLLRRELLVRRFDVAESRVALRRFGAGVALFPAATLVGLLSPVAMLVLYAAFNAFYIGEQTPAGAGASRSDDKERVLG